jgi:hypothetical protein
VKLTPQKVIVLTIVTTVVCAVLTYFVKAKPVNLEFVTPQSVLPNYTATYPGDTKLSDRIVKSYDLAMILVQSPYMQKNYNALESIRRWARERFEQQPDFLHPTVLPVKETNRDTVFGAFGHNLFAQVHAMWCARECRAGTIPTHIRRSVGRSLISSDGMRKQP